MELVLKQPKNKPPFLGIQFENEYKASTLNQNWPNSYRSSLYSIELEPEVEGMSLVIKLESFGFNYKYENVKYDPVKLSKWLLQTKAEKQYNFGHVIKVLDTHKVVRTTVNSALWVLKVKEINLFQVQT